MKTVLFHVDLIHKDKVKRCRFTTIVLLPPFSFFSLWYLPPITTSRPPPPFLSRWKSHHHIYHNEEANCQIIYYKWGEKMDEVNKFPTTPTTQSLKTKAKIKSVLLYHIVALACKEPSDAKLCLQRNRKRRHLYQDQTHANPITSHLWFFFFSYWYFWNIHADFDFASIAFGYVHALIDETALFLVIGFLGFFILLIWGICFRSKPFKVIMFQC